MKITAFLVFLFSLHLSAATVAQTVTLSEHKVPLEKVLNDIRQQSGYVFFYNQDWMQQSLPVDLEVKNLPLEKALKACFKDQPFDFAIVNKTIVLKLKEKQLVSPNAVAPASVTVSGKVTNELGEPMNGVVIRQKDNPTNGTVTDANGNYSITVPDNKSVIIFSFIGLETQEISAKDLPPGSVIKLKASENNLQEVVISKGYYDEKKELSTGDVSVVTAETIEEQPVLDPLQALIGRVPGLNIQQSSGMPGAYSTVYIRGQNSIANGTVPLYIIDGVPFYSESLSSTFTINALGPGTLGQANQTNGAGMSPFNALNPADIESIEVLKDADATALYGSRGANGVVLITTKKGKTGDTKVTFNLNQGIGQVTRTMQFLNTQQYLQMRHQAFANDGLMPSASDYDLNGDWDTTRNTNWQKVLIGNTAHYTNAGVSVSGGTANTQFLISGGNTRQTTVFPGNYPDDKTSVHFNLNHISNNQKFEVELTANYVNDRNVLPQSDFTSNIILAPDAPTVYNRDGTINWQIIDGTSTFNNPVAVTVNSSTSVTNNLNASLNLSYKILPGLIFKSSLGYNHDELNANSLNLAASDQPPYNDQASSRSSIFTNTIYETWNIEPQLSYQRKIAKGQLNILLGTTFEQKSQQSIAQGAQGFPSDVVVDNPSAASNYYLGGNTQLLYRYTGIFGRIGYDWDDKYLINLTARRDGSSRFGPGKQFGNFGAIGIGWIFSNEDFAKNALSWLSFGKLRASYGTSGNDQLQDYQFLSSYSANSNAYQGNPGLFPNSLANPLLAWEVDKKLEGGLEFGLLKDRINVSISYYYNQTSNELLGYLLPFTTGFSSLESNLPAVIQNSGIEAELHTINFKTKDFSWTTSATFTEPKNKLVSYPGLAGSSYSSTYVIGKSLSIQELYQYTGVNPQTGVYTYATKNANGIPSNPQDLVVTQPVTQIFYGGLTNTFSYKGFELDIFIQFVKQNAFNYFKSVPYNVEIGQALVNVPAAVLNSWQAPGDVSRYGKFSTTDQADPNGLYTHSTAVVGDASYIRVKNVTFSYAVPTTWQQWAHMKNAKIFFQGQNLFTFTHYLGLDPETQGLNLPPLRMLTLGVSASF